MDNMVGGLLKLNRSEATSTCYLQVFVGLYLHGTYGDMRSDEIPAMRQGPPCTPLDTPIPLT